MELAVIDNIIDYAGSTLWLVATIVSLIYIFLKSKKETKKKLVLLLILSVVVVANEFSYKLICRFADSASYYRFFWMIPYVIVVSFALVKLLCELWNGVGKLSQKASRIIAIILVFVIAFGFSFAQRNYNYFGMIKENVIQNKYLLGDDIVQLKWILDEERMANECAAEPTIACAESVAIEYPTYDGGIVLATHRNAYYYGHNTDELNRYGLEEYLMDICNEGEKVEPILAKTAIVELQVDYLIVNKAFNLEGYMVSIDCDRVGQTDSLEVYRYRYNEYDKVTDEASVKAIQTRIGYEQNDVTIDIGLSNEYKLLVLNDLHITSYDDVSIDATTDKAYKDTILDRFQNMFRTTTNVPSMDCWTELSSILDSYKADGIIFCGDMVDYASTTQMKILKNGLDNIDTPILYLRADHDLGNWYSNEQTVDDSIAMSSTVSEYNDVFVNEYDDFIVLGWNNSTSHMTKEGLETAKEVFVKGKPIVLATHVPINSLIDDGLYKSSTEYDDKGRAKLWGENCLYAPNDTTAEFLDLVLADDSPVKAVICGHLHYQYQTKLNDNITEYVLPPTFKGGLTEVTIK